MTLASKNVLMTENEKSIDQLVNIAREDVIVKGRIFCNDIKLKFSKDLSDKTLA